MTTTKTIPKGWKETTLGEVAEIIGGGTPKTNVSEYWGGDIPWLSVSDFNTGNRWAERTEKTITREGLESSATKVLDVGDLVISARGTVGAFTQLKTPMAFNQSSYGLRAKKETTNNFLFYLLKQNSQQLKKKVHGAVFDTITRDTFYQIEVFLPPFAEQKEIAVVLSSLDDKIELLRKQNETLEQIARTIFHEWFVHFNFPNKDGKPHKASGGKMIDSELGKIPEGWEVKGLSDVAEFLNGLALQKFPSKNKDDELPVIKIRELKSGVTTETDKASKNIPEKYIVQNGDLLFSWSGSLDVVIWQHGNGALNQHLFKVTSADYPKWFIYLWLLFRLPFFRSIAENKATTMGHIQRVHLEQAKAIVPTRGILRTMDVVLSPIFEKIVSNNTALKTHSETRDTLLPKLMSGEVRVKI